nr:hypothetical protein B0A51_10821 [Rachicladosporium sp. CCFEE 5018]
MPLPLISPPLINSSNPWATTLEDLQTIFDCPQTGAVTTRTSLLKGFEHDDHIHQYTFFDAQGTQAKAPTTSYTSPQAAEDHENATGSLNTLGYSPVPLKTYLAMIARVVADSKLPEDVRSTKPFIISVTGSADAVLQCYRLIRSTQRTVSNPLCMEINLSCPNIPSKPPPAYSEASLTEYLTVLADEKAREAKDGGMKVAIGIKTPPYTYHDQFRSLISALLASQKPTCPVDFITATNTLGSCLLLDGTGSAPAINSASGAGIGGLAGTPLHPLALGNVRTISSMLNEHEALHGIDIIGIGGVSDGAGFHRMRSVGAKAVGVGTALGRRGVGVFGEIWEHEKLLAA